MSTMLWGEDEGRTARAINRRDERGRMARHVAAEWDLTITRPPPQAGCIGFDHEVTLPRIDWTGVAIAAVTVGLLCGLWGFVIWYAWREVTHG